MVNVVWTETALNSLRLVFEFYALQANHSTAKKIVKGITEETLLLKTNYAMGQRENLLKNKMYEYRYLVKGNHKIIYWIEPKHVFIALVFDCRQNPEKLQTLR